MSDNILNETFQKHLKLLHEHLNISEITDDGTRRPDWDSDGVTGYRVPKECIVEVEKEQLNEQLIQKTLDYIKKYFSNHEQLIQKTLDYIKKHFSKEKIINWLKWLKTGLQTEWKESKEMLRIWAKMIKGMPVSEREKEAAREQLKDIVKMGMWAGIGISPIPEPIEVPIVLALANLFKVELLPSAFLNKINYSKMDTAGGTSEEEPYSIDEKLNNRYEK